MSMTPPARPRSADLDEKTFRFYGRFTGWLVLALLLSYLGLQLPLPWRLLAVAAGLAGIVGGIVLLVQCLRRRLPIMMHISAILVLLSCGLFTFTATTQAIFWQATVEFEQCRDGALTERSMDRCLVEYEDGMLNSVPGLGR
ncbi:hypothetical protein [Nesterenkonia lutea]|uniref:Uncharacterized protein n=1 Tax=Nesterenkonia lutea TaxID=272919 RepID=A0ABR9JBT3_9MICC|nr:hypothetical protein [Nesterenkonia lutea]MBE1522942.1 hypothetical protein [Nesterenkonia lutea]